MWNTNFNLNAQSNGFSFTWVEEVYNCTQKNIVRNYFTSTTTPRTQYSSSWSTVQQMLAHTQAQIVCVLVLVLDVLCYWTHWTCGTFSQENDVKTFQNVHQVNNSHALINVFHSSTYLWSAVCNEDWSWKQLCPQTMDNVMMWAMWMLFLDSEKESQMLNQAIPPLTNWIKEFEGDTRNAVPVVHNTNCV